MPTFEQIPLKDIKLSGDNQRRIDESSEGFQELKLSIAGGGVRVPIRVQRAKDKYILVYGERRYRACLALGMETIPALVGHGAEAINVLDTMYIENKFREDLTPMEEAAELAMLIDRWGGKAKLIADTIGKDEQWVRIRANIIGGLSKPWMVAIKNAEKHPEFAGWTI